MKILHVITGLGVGGAQVALSQLVDGAISAGHNVRVISLSDDVAFADMFPSSVLTVLGGFSQGFLSAARMTIALRRIIRDEKPDIVQTWLYHSDIIGTIASLFSKANPMLIWSLRCSDLLTRTKRIDYRVLRFVLPLLSKRADAIVANAAKSISDHERLGYRPKRWFHIDNAIDAGHFKPDSSKNIDVRSALGLTHDVSIIAHAARFDIAKGHDVFCQALGIYFSDHPSAEKAHVLMCGPGVTRDNPTFAALLGSLPVSHVHCLGMRRDLDAIFAAANIAVSSARCGEGFPTMIAEAMAVGVVPIATDVGDSARIVENIGFTVPPDDVSGLAAVICEALMMDQEDRVKRGTAARERICEDFTKQVMVGRYFDLYRELLKNQCVG